MGTQWDYRNWEDFSWEKNKDRSIYGIGDVVTIELPKFAFPVQMVGCCDSLDANRETLEECTFRLLGWRVSGHTSEDTPWGEHLHFSYEWLVEPFDNLDHYLCPHDFHLFRVPEEWLKPRRLNSVITGLGNYIEVNGERFPSEPTKQVLKAGEKVRVTNGPHLNREGVIKAIPYPNLACLTFPENGGEKWHTCPTDLLVKLPSVQQSPAPPQALIVAMKEIDRWKAREQELSFRESLLRDYQQKGMIVYHRSSGAPLILERKISLLHHHHRVEGWLAFNTLSKSFEEVLSAEIVNSKTETQTPCPDYYWLYGAGIVVASLSHLLLHFWYNL